MSETMKIIRELAEPRGVEVTEVDGGYSVHNMQTGSRQWFPDADTLCCHLICVPRIARATN